MVIEKREICKLCDGFLDEPGTMQCGALHKVIEEKTRNEVLNTLLEPQVEALEKEYFEKDDDELEKEYEDNFGEKIKIVR